MDSSVKKTKLASFGTLKSGPKLFKISVYDGQILIIYFNTDTEHVKITVMQDELTALTYLEEQL